MIILQISDVVKVEYTLKSLGKCSSVREKRAWKQVNGYDGNGQQKKRGCGIVRSYTAPNSSAQNAPTQKKPNIKQQTDSAENEVSLLLSLIFVTARQGLPRMLRTAQTALQRYGSRLSLAIMSEISLHRQRELFCISRVPFPRE